MTYLKSLAQTHSANVRQGTGKQLSSLKEAVSFLLGNHRRHRVPRGSLSDCPMEFPGEVYLVETKWTLAGYLETCPFS